MWHLSSSRSVISYRVVSFFRFPIFGVSGPPRFRLLDRSRYIKADSWPMASLNVPCRFMLGNLTSVTLPLEQEIPSQELQGSVEPVQLCGPFFQLFIKAWSAVNRHCEQLYPCKKVACFLYPDEMQNIKAYHLGSLSGWSLAGALPGARTEAAATASALCSTLQARPPHKSKCQQITANSDGRPWRSLCTK